jgi:hypothetical protein
LVDSSCKELKLESTYEENQRAFFGKDNTVNAADRKDFESNQELQNYKETLLLSLFPQKYLERLVNAESLESLQALNLGSGDVELIQRVREQLLMLEKMSIRQQRQRDIDEVSLQ